MGPLSLYLDPLGADTGAANSFREHIYTAGTMHQGGSESSMYTPSLSSHSDSPGRLDIISALRI